MRVSKDAHSAWCWVGSVLLRRNTILGREKQERSNTYSRCGSQGKQSGDGQDTVDFVSYLVMHKVNEFRIL